MATEDARWGRWSRAATAGARDIWAKMPPDAAADVRTALVRVSKARNPRDAVGALEAEIERLFDVVAPRLVDRPLPVRTPARALLTVSVVAGAAAAVDEIEAIGLLLPDKLRPRKVPTLKLVAVASFSSLVIESYVAASLRVHMLQAAGREVDASAVTRDTLRAMTGRDDVPLTKGAAQMLTRRVLRRWARGVVPFVGIGYATVDARRTITAIAEMPLD